MEFMVHSRQFKGTDDGWPRVLGGISEKPTEGEERERWTWRALQGNEALAVSSRWHCELNKSGGKSGGGQVLTPRVFTDVTWANKDSNGYPGQLHFS